MSNSLSPSSTCCPASRDPSATGRGPRTAPWGRRCTAAVLFSLAVALLAGCKSGGFSGSLDAGVKKLLEPRKTPQQYMLIAVSSSDADARRDAVIQINRSKQYNKEWAIKGFVAIATLETEPQTRCIAIRALVRSGDPRAVEAALKIINYQDYPPQEVYPPPPVVRWDATAALADLSAAGRVPEELRTVVHTTLIKQLKMDADRHARIAAGRGLGYYPQDESVKALIDGLRDEDFAVIFECEGALVRLTGQTHNGNALAWEEWYAAHPDDAFAHAGEIPESRRPPYTNGLGKLHYDMRQTAEWLWPGSKEE
jgi:HEAT repeat protein